MVALPSARITALRRREQHPNLLAAWGFDEGSGTIARDSSEHNVPLTVDVGLTWPAGHTGGTATGNAGAGSAHRSWTISNPITIMGWARPLNLTAGTNRPLFGVWDTTDSTGATQVALWAQRGDFGTPNVLQGAVRINGGLAAVHHTALSLNTWVHLALSHDGSTIRMFRDGTLVTSTSNAGTILNAGAYHFCVAPNPTNAQIDDVRVLNLALTTDAQVSAFMGNPVAP